MFVPDNSSSVHVLYIFDGLFGGQCPWIMLADAGAGCF